MDASSILQITPFNSHVSIYTSRTSTSKSTPTILPHYLKEQARSAVIWAWRFFFFFFFFLFFSYCLRCSINAHHEWASMSIQLIPHHYLPHHYLAVPHSHKWIIIPWQDGPIQDENSQPTDRNPLDRSLLAQLQHTVPASGASLATLNTKY